MSGLAAEAYEVRHHRIDATHSNILATWDRLDRPDWPDLAGWARLREADRLERLEPFRKIRPQDGRIELSFDLPMPSMSLVELDPIDARTSVPRTGDPPPLIAGELRNRSGLAIQLLANGSIFAIRHGDVLINQVLASPAEGGIANLYLRRRSREGITAFPLIGPSSGSAFRVSAREARWEGSAAGVDYVCTLRVADSRPVWFWSISLTNASRRPLSLDAILAQDLGIAEEAAVRTNELYTSQYIDHTVLQDRELGFVVCSRQNLPQDGAYPWIAHGCLDGAVGYLTDGFQFYGLSYRASNVAAALARPRLTEPDLPVRVRPAHAAVAGGYFWHRGEWRDHVLRRRSSRTTQPPRASATCAALGQRRGRIARLRPAGTPRLRANPGRRRRGQPVRGGPSRRDRRSGDPLRCSMHRRCSPSKDLGPDDLDRFFGRDWRHVERDADGNAAVVLPRPPGHVVLRAKELVQERPTGHIMRSGRDLFPTDDTMSVTAWMAGVFASQLTIGNTSYNKLLSVARNPLNVLKAGGQRIFVRGERGRELLGLPSAFEMGPNHARWIYQDDRSTIAIRVETSLDEPVFRLVAEVERGGPLELVVTHDIVLGTE